MAEVWLSLRIECRGAHEPQSFPMAGLQCTHGREFPGRNPEPDLGWNWVDFIEFHWPFFNGYGNNGFFGENYGHAWLCLADNVCVWVCACSISVSYLYLTVDNDGKYCVNDYSRFGDSTIF